MLVSPLEFKVNGIYFKYCENKLEFEDTNKECVIIHGENLSDVLEKCKTYFSLQTVKGIETKLRGSFEISS